MVREVKVGIIGFGTVGSGVASCLINNVEVIARRTGVKPVLSKIADIDITTSRGIDLPSGLLTDNADELIESVDVVVELVGGTSAAKDFILKALKKGKPVVTANKALLALHGEEIFYSAEKSKADIYYEASVCGGIPIIKILREGLVGNRIEKIYGIMNGTCNYILTKMDSEKKSFKECLSEAQRLGYAEANPTLDVDGHDTAHKAAILASLAYGEWFGVNPIYVEGISNISQEDLRFASKLGYKIKLLAIIKQENDDVQIRVHPTLIPEHSLLANVNGVFNTIMLKGHPIGEALFYGRGAGRDATASAVLADLVDVALNLKFGSHRRVPSFRIGKQFRNLINIDDIICRYYFHLKVLDKPGVMAKVTSIFARFGISISSIMQREEHGSDSESVSLLIITHPAKEKQSRDAVKELSTLEFINEKITLIRIEDL